MFVGTVWLIITSKMGLNVSSTHSISRLTHDLHVHGQRTLYQGCSLEPAAYLLECVVLLACSCTVGGCAATVVVVIQQLRNRNCSQISSNASCNACAAPVHSHLAVVLYLARCQQARFVPAVGAIVGFALVWAGKDGVIWAVRDNTGESLFCVSFTSTSLCMAVFRPQIVSLVL